MRKLLALLCGWPALALSTTVYNYFAPTLAGAGSTCAANQVWYLNAAGTLVNCSAQMTFNPTGANLQLGAAGGTVAALDLYAASAATDAHKTRLSVNSTGTLVVAPVNDAGTVTANNFITVTRSGNTFGGFTYQDTVAGTTSLTVNDNQFTYLAGSGGQNLSFSIDGNDIKFKASANSAPLMQFFDPGIADALAGIIYWTGPSGNAGGELAQYCVSPAFSLGAGLTNGPANGYCLVSTGDQLFGFATAAYPLIFGSNGVFAGQIFAADQGWAIGAPTGGDKGSGTLNAQGLFVQGVAVATKLAGTTGSIGGALLAGGCDSGTATVTGATVGQAVVASAVTSGAPGAAFYRQADVTAANTVTVQICAAIAGTPTSSTYTVRVLP